MLKLNIFILIVLFFTSNAMAIDVKKFGATGDGRTDDTKAILKAITNLKDNDVLYFPPGTYLISEQCLLIRGRKNIEIKGDNPNTTTIKPLKQEVTKKKQYYPSTICIDQSSNVIISGLSIESKGENYGDTDAAKDVAFGTARVDFSVKNGGHALLITRSFNVKAINLIGRRCGSVGVFYTGSCSNISFINCFANAESVGYAGFAVDNWFEPRSVYNRKYYFKNCRVIAEPNKSPFSGKAGIVIEGNNHHIINIFIDGLTVQGVSGNPTVKYEGFAVGACDCNITAKNIIGRNNFSGIFISTRGDITDSTTYSLSNCQFINNYVNGARIKLQGKAPMKVYMENIAFSTKSKSFWSADKNNFSFSNSIGLYFAFYKGIGKSEISLNNVTSTGSQYGLLAGDAFNIKLNKCNISGLYNAINMNGGTCEASGGSFISENGPVVFLTPSNRLENNKSNGKNYVQFISNNISIERKDNGAIYQYKGEKNLLKTFSNSKMVLKKGLNNTLK